MKKIITLLALAFCLNANAQIITTVAGNGTQGYSGDGGQDTNAELSKPFGVAFDAFDNMYIADEYNNRIRKVNTAGIISTVAGNGTQGYSGDGGQAISAELYYPTGVAFDASNNMYIVDAYNNRIRMINTSGVITTIAGNGTAGYSGDGAAAISAELNGPSGIAILPSGELFIADAYNQRVRRVSNSGIITTVAGNGTQGFSGDGAQATAAKLFIPLGVAIDGASNLYIADLGNARIRMVNTAGIINTIAGNGVVGYSGDGVAATASELNAPSGVTIDASGNLYIADQSNNRIRKVNISGIMTTICGDGILGFSGDGAAATSAELHYPSGLALNTVGNLYIVDQNNSRIRMVTNVAAAGIEQYANSNEQINIYPNPNNGSFVIEPNSATKQTVQVYDVNGKLVLSQTINGKTTVDAGSLNEGVYNISLLSNEGVVNKRLLIVR